MPPVSSLILSHFLPSPDGAAGVMPLLFTLPALLRFCTCPATTHITALPYTKRQKRTFSFCTLPPGSILHFPAAFCDIAACRAAHYHSYLMEAAILRATVLTTTAACCALSPACRLLDTHTCTSHTPATPPARAFPVPILIPSLPTILKALPALPYLPPFYIYSF